jgi:thiol-disulfide isomerase/thioredoxin
VIARRAPACRGTLIETAAAVIAAAVPFLTAAITSSQAETDATMLQPWRAGVAPAFTLPSISSGQPIRLASERGRVVLVHFFATWCEPCREELPALRRLVARAEPGSLAVLAIAVADVDLRVERFLQTIPVNFPVLLDRDRAVAKAWTIWTLPSTVILDGNLRPRLGVEADFPWDQIEPAALLDQIKSVQRNQPAKFPKEQTP